ncbi:Cell division inhibitor [Pseudomonas syringae pv. primulae]|nr:Cell division inhibitor [Pseudomonas syringae pv. primulae]
MWKTYTRYQAVYKKAQWPLTLYFDGECPLCAREIKVLRARAAADRLLFVDISDDVFDASLLGLTLTQMESSLHARFDDGTWVTGLDATLWSWRAAGLGKWVAPLSWPILRPLFTVLYRLFCRFRPHLAWLPHPDGGRRCGTSSCTVAESVVMKSEASAKKKTS